MNADSTRRYMVMSHIHTELNQHDTTVSFYVVRLGGDEPLVLVHLHRKLKKLMQLGGHIELLENPWQAIAHEIVEESGFSLDELRVLQPFGTTPSVRGAVVHPVPAVLLTFKNSANHFHTDLSYAFVTDQLPTSLPLDGESEDLRWLSLSEYDAALEKGEAIEDVRDIYAYILDTLLAAWEQVPTTQFSLDSPDHLAFDV